MKLRIDEEADALHLELVDVPVVESEEVAPGVIVDYDESNQVVGIEGHRGALPVQTAAAGQFGGFPVPDDEEGRGRGMSAVRARGHGTG
jgi:uncharacterized protein YuzE